MSFRLLRIIARLPVSRKEQGQDIVEYALLLALIALIALVAIQAVANAISSVWVAVAAWLTLL